MLASYRPSSATACACSAELAPLPSWRADLASRPSGLPAFQAACSAAPRFVPVPFPSIAAPVGGSPWPAGRIGYKLFDGPTSRPLNSPLYAQSRPSAWCCLLCWLTNQTRPFPPPPFPRLPSPALPAPSGNQRLLAVRFHGCSIHFLCRCPLSTLVMFTFRLHLSELGFPLYFSPFDCPHRLCPPTDRSYRPPPLARERPPAPFAGRPPPYPCNSVRCAPFARGTAAGPIPHTPSWPGLRHPHLVSLLVPVSTALPASQTHRIA